MSYELIVKPIAEKEMKRLAKPLQKRILAKLLQLKLNPRLAGAVKLTNAGSTWRIRVGDYRIVYEINQSDTTVFVTMIAHRREVYRGL